LVGSLIVPYLENINVIWIKGPKEGVFWRDSFSDPPHSRPTQFAGTRYFCLWTLEKLDTLLL